MITPHTGAGPATNARAPAQLRSDQPVCGSTALDPRLEREDRGRIRTALQQDRRARIPGVPVGNSDVAPGLRLVDLVAA
jgi:hypothetical protein